MPRPPLMRHPIRMHISVEKETARRLYRMARERHTTATGLVRELVESYTAGRVTVRPGSMAEAVQRFREFADGLPRVPKFDVVKEIRGSRDRGL